MLVGGIILGIVILGSVVLLNDMKFNDTIGSQGNQQALEDASRATDAIREDLTGLRERVRAETTNASFADAFAENVSVYSSAYSNMTFEDGIVFVNASFSEAASTDGRLLSQTSAGNQTFRLNPDGGATQYDWTMASDATLLSPFNVTVTEFRDSVDPNPANTTFVVTGSEGRTWELKANRTDSGDGSLTGPSLYVFVDGDVEASERVGPGVEIDPTDGTINGSQVDGFAFSEYVVPPYTVEVDNEGPPGQMPRGLYRLGTDSTVRDTSANQPTVQVYDAATPAVNITYQRPELQYETTIYLNATGGGE